MPGLGLTLDPSHYLVGTEPTQDYDDLFPFVRHVRLRDTAPDRLQVRVGQGQVEYGRIISQLSRERYERALSVDIHDTPDTGYPMEPEVRKLKYPARKHGVSRSIVDASLKRERRETLARSPAAGSGSPNLFALPVRSKSMPARACPHAARCA